MATALSGHIDDRDGSRTRLETSAPGVHTSFRTGQAGGPSWRKLRFALIDDALPLHHQQTKNVLVSYSPKKLGFF